MAQNPPLRVLLSGPRGFCAGVDRAIRVVEEAIRRFGSPVYVRHEIVHNRTVVEALEAQGAVFVEELDEVPPDAHVVFSAHGVPKSVPFEAERRHLHYYDATCPLVSKVHREAERHFGDGGSEQRHILMIGHAGREAGERTKIAVISRDKDVDPVGACVGMKGMRVQSIIRELRGEKIDIIEFSEEITTFAEKALQPAKVSRVSITDLGEKQLEVIVDDTQLSLAIGKKGQNVRLAAKLLGWKIDIKSEEEKRQEVEQAMAAMTGGPQTPIEQVTELGEHVLEKLIAAGITTVEHLADMTAEELGEVPGIGDKSVDRIAVAVRHYFGQYEEGEERPAEAVSELSASLENNTASDSSVAHGEPTEADGKPYNAAEVTEGSEAGETLLLAADANEPGGVEGDLTEESSMSKTPEAIIAERGLDGIEPIEVEESADELLEREEEEGQLDGFGSDADVREAGIELDNETMEDLAAQSGEISNETIDPDENTRG